MDRRAPKGQTILGVEYCLFVHGFARASSQINEILYTFFNTNSKAMRRFLLFIYALLAITALFLTGCIPQSEIDDLQMQIDELKSVQIASIQQQISGINGSLSSLMDMDKELKGYISTLQGTAAELQKSLNATNAKINEIDSINKTLLEQLQALSEELDSELTNINKSIAALQAMDVSLEQKIENLKQYVDKELKASKDWASATFATLEQYQGLTADIAGIKTTITSLTTSITNLETRLKTQISSEIADALEDIQKAIRASESSMKTWVNERLAGYYTIAEMEAKLEVLENAYVSGDATLSGEIGKLREELNKAQTELTSAYQSAITEAITQNNGTLNEKIAADIQKATDSLQTTIDALSKRLDDLEARISALEATMEELIGMVQSVVVIPNYSDGSVKISGRRRNVIRFEVYPLNAAKKLVEKDPSALSLDYVETETKSTIFHNLQITEASFDGEVITIIADGSGLSEDIKRRIQTASARLRISDGTTTRSSEFFPMYYAGPDIPDIVDMGLSVKWATFNLGASAPEDYGDYYAWGETDPYYEDGYALSESPVWIPGKTAGYDWATYSWCEGSYNRLTKYNTKNEFGAVDDITVLENEDDAAYVMLKGKWRMPTDEEWTELRENCIWSWTTFNGVNGYKITSKKKGYTDKWIFLPAAGRRDQTSIYEVGSMGHYRSSSLNTDNPRNALNTGFNSSSAYGYNYGYRYSGHSVRPAYDDNIHVTGVSLNKESLGLCVGLTETLIATITPSDATNTNVKWTSSDTNVATVDADGVVTAVAVGNAEITVMTVDGHITATCAVSVKSVPIPEMIDLGLSVKWASFNLGASAPEECGDYYAWGETEPKYEKGYAQSSSPVWKEGQTGYNDASYAWYDGSNTSITKYNTSSSYGVVDNKVMLEAVDDAAFANLGDFWRMPTDSEWTELKNNCTWIWTTLNGVSGYKVNSNKEGYSDKWLFLPAAGFRGQTRLRDVNDYGHYWSSSIINNSPNIAWCVYFFSSHLNVHSNNDTRIDGFTIRPVYGEIIQVSSVSLNFTSVTLLIGNSETLIATVLPSNAMDKNVTWTSSDPNVASVDQAGKVTAIKEGDATITASAGGKTASCSVTVVKDYLDLVHKVTVTLTGQGIMATNAGTYYSRDYTIRNNSSVAIDVYEIGTSNYISLNQRINAGGSYTHTLYFSYNVYPTVTVKFRYNGQEYQVSGQ